MTVLDAYALIAFLVGGPAAAPVRGILREGGAALAGANLVEVLDVSSRVHGLPIDRATEALDPLFEEALVVLPLDRDAARRAASIRATHYHRDRCPISLADSILLASVPAGASVATADPDVLRVADAEGIATVVLPAQG